MRLSPTPEQRDYLRSIGAGGVPPSAVPVAPASTPAPAPLPAPPAERSSTGAIVLLVILALILTGLAAKVCSQPPPAVPGASAGAHRPARVATLIPVAAPATADAAQSAVILAIVLGLVGCALSVILLAVHRRLTQRIDDLERRLRAIEDRAVADEVEDSPAPAPRPAARPRCLPRERLLQAPPSPDEKMRALMARAARLRELSHRPSLPTGLWQLGMATAAGHVRTENQDYALCFKIRDHEVAIVADGCGGHAHGRWAAHRACVAAAAAVIRAYGSESEEAVSRPETVATNAVRCAARRVTLDGEHLGFGPDREGLRTTLIVLVGDARHVGYAYIGDGGGCRVRTSTGEVHHWLVPQNVPGRPDVLAASLGPVMHGEPMVGTLEREAGDVFLIGSDGVFERYDRDGFPRHVLAACRQLGGDLQRTADGVVAELANFRDAQGYVCDDNLTLAIVGDGTEPPTPGVQSAPGAAGAIGKEVA